MTLTDAFAAYLQAGARGARRELAAALRSDGYHLEGTLLERNGWTEGTDGWPRVFVGSRPPGDAEPGDVWLDRVELMPMVLVEEPTYREGAPTRPAWLALRPVARWQFRAFVAVAPIVGRTVQVALPVTSLDPARLAGPEVAPMVSTTEGEASLYARWFGKTLASSNRWAGAAHTLRERAAQLWTPGLREWTGERCSFDEGLRVRIGPDNVDRHPDDEFVADRDGDADVDPETCMLVGEAAYSSTTGFRTSIGPVLLTSADDAMLDFERITLASLFPRPSD